MKTEIEKRLSRVCLWLMFASLPVWTSCVSSTMRVHFQDYNTAYADALNEQMLLNLARLQNGDPAYYLAIGAIDDRLTVTATGSAGSTGTFTDQKTTVSPANTLTRLLSSVFGYNVSGGATRTVQPEFQFIPINNVETAQQVLEPMDPNVFLSLYQQGYPIDQLMRIMIERVETPRLLSGQQFVLINSPTCGTPQYYERFLRACAILRTLQMHGYLSLEAKPDLEPLGPVTFSSRSSGAGGPVGGNNQPSSGGQRGSGANRGGGDPPGSEAQPPSSGSGSAQEGNSAPTLTDFTDAEAKGMVLTNNDRGWWVYRQRTVPKFFLRYEFAPTNAMAYQELMSQAATNADARGKLIIERVSPIIEFLKTNNNDYPDISDNYSAITNVVCALYLGISIQTDLSQSDTNATHLVLRSFNRTMEAVASEQAGFDALAAMDATNFAEMIPKFERRPSLQMMWPDKSVALEPPLQTIQYDNKTYQITDPKVTNPEMLLDTDTTWNRDTFRLLVDLNSLVTVDISKFQRQVLELEQ
ncbi:MAG TPA: hypothetical protein VMB22_06750 [Verrucomicrobiae bacterium]|nr:hypothetical protein [Verrucomicrobiae bacterium]